jgi:hypothetical protein
VIIKEVRLFVILALAVQTEEEYPMANELRFSQLNEKQQQLFRSPHWVHVSAANNRELFILTGNVVVPLISQGSTRVVLEIAFPQRVLLPRCLEVEYWAILVTADGVTASIAELSKDIRYGVERFAWDPWRYPNDNRRLITSAVDIWADIVAHGPVNPGTQFCIGYNCTFSGVAGKAPEVPPIP